MKDHEEGWELRPGQLGYPEKLADLKVGNDERPATLYGIGDPACLELPIVGVLGSRVASKDALLAAQASSLVAGSIGAAVMTGGAMGVGAEALRAASAAGVPTIVLAGTGADVAYPESSRDAFEAAVANGGAVLSLEPWGQGPRRSAFPRRNEAMACLCDSLVVCECPMPSGTAMVAATAHDLGKPVHAVLPLPGIPPAPARL